MKLVKFQVVNAGPGSGETHIIKSLTPTPGPRDIRRVIVWTIALFPRGFDQVIPQVLAS